MKSKPILITLCVSSLMFLGTIGYSSIDKKIPLKASYSFLSPESKRQVTCLADNIYFESVNEPVKGQKAVAHVTMNRLLSKNYANTICGVVQQKVNGVCQFSWYCMEKHLKQRLTIRKTEEYNQILDLATEVFLNYSVKHDVTKGSTFYHADYVNPGWALQRVSKIGRHIFYRSHSDVSNFERK